MGFQVNGVTVLDMNRTFANSAFPARVNGNPIYGSGDLKYFRPGVTTNHEVGDYLACSHTSANNSYNYTVFDAGTTHAASGFVTSNNGYVFTGGYSQNTTWLTANNVAVSPAISGTWRVCVRGMFDTHATAPEKMTIFFSRIS